MPLKWYLLISSNKKEMYGLNWFGWWHCTISNTGSSIPELRRQGTVEDSGVDVILSWGRVRATRHVLLKVTGFCFTLVFRPV